MRIFIYLFIITYFRLNHSTQQKEKKMPKRRTNARAHGFIILYYYESKVDRYWETLLRLAVNKNIWYPTCRCTHAMLQIRCVLSMLCPDTLYVRRRFFVFI